MKLYLWRLFFFQLHMHASNTCIGKRLSGWNFRSFTHIYPLLILNLMKSIVFLIVLITVLNCSVLTWEKIFLLLGAQKDLSYECDLLAAFNIYSLERRRKDILSIFGKFKNILFQITRTLISILFRSSPETYLPVQ